MRKTIVSPEITLIFRLSCDWLQVTSFPKRYDVALHDELLFVDQLYHHPREIISVYSNLITAHINISQVVKHILNKHFKDVVMPLILYNRGMSQSLVFSRLTVVLVILSLHLVDYSFEHLCSSSHILVNQFPLYPLHSGRRYCAAETQIRWVTV